VGKLTVSKILAAEYGLHVLDNHASLDSARRLFTFGDPRLAPLVEAIRVTLLSAAAQAALEVVSTLVFAHPIDRDHVARLQAASESHGARTAFVQLLADRRVLAQRVLERSATATNKITDVAQLWRMLDRYDLATPINDADLSIDATNLSADEVARRIADHVGLSARTGSVE
jgi:hypothetical protein